MVVRGIRAFLPVIAAAWAVSAALFAVTQAVPRREEAAASPLTFASAVPALDGVFAWAKTQALAYVFTGDPVGDWYEAALPGREAFCMRDVSHQAAGANVLGLAAINKNLFRKFAAAIAESRDWCSFWEINRHDKPAPVDYRNDGEFWYNLPANFDVLDALGRQYLWTGDRSYLDDPVFLNFYERTVADYIERWALAPDRILARPARMNLRVPFDPRDPYRASRGLASYDEDKEGMNAGADLPAAQYAAFRAYAMILSARGDAGRASAMRRKAAEAKKLFHASWWDPIEGRYFVNHWPDGTFRHGIGQEFLVYFGVTAPGEPTRQAIREMAGRRDVNIEMRSYYPEIVFRHGRDADAVRTILYLGDPATGRREYPEVSFAVVGALAGGLMGIAPDARDGSVSTLARLPGDCAWAEMKSVPVLGTLIDVRHDGPARTGFHNAGGAPVVWKAAFKGRHDVIRIDGRPRKAAAAADEAGGDYSFVSVEVGAGERAVATLS